VLCHPIARDGKTFIRWITKKKYIYKKEINPSPSPPLEFPDNWGWQRFGRGKGFAILIFLGWEKRSN